MENCVYQVKTAKRSIVNYTKMLFKKNARHGEV